MNEPLLTIAAAEARQRAHGGSRSMLITAASHAVQIERLCRLLDALLIAGNRQGALKRLAMISGHTGEAGSCLMEEGAAHPKQAEIKGRTDWRKDGCELAERAGRLARALYTLGAEGLQTDAWSVWCSLYRTVDELCLVLDEDARKSRLAA